MSYIDWKRDLWKPSVSFIKLIVAVNILQLAFCQNFYIIKESLVGGYLNSKRLVYCLNRSWGLREMINYFGSIEQCSV